MTHDEMIQVITAHKEGKTIQIRVHNEKQWNDCVPTWDFDRFEYRLKPAEPKKAKLEAWLNTDSGFVRWCISDKYSFSSPAKGYRIPELDKEITLPEGVEL